MKGARGEVSDADREEDRKTEGMTCTFRRNLGRHLASVLGSLLYPPVVGPKSILYAGRSPGSACRNAA